MINKKTFTKEERLLKPSEYQHVYKKGKWTANRELSINFEKHERKTSRIGITVSKKVSKRAVDRNRIKRQIREWFRENKQRIPSLDVIVTAKPSINDKTGPEIQRSLKDVWHKTKKKL